MIIGDEKAERELAEKTRDEFNEAARGPETDEAEKGDQAEHDHDIEPPLDELREGAAMSGGGPSLFEQMKASRSQDKDRGFGLG